MKKNTITWLLAFAPFFGFSQGVKANLYDKFLKKQRVETNALLVSGLGGKNKLSLGFTALGSTLYFNVSGAGWGTTTVDSGDELNLLFSNDSVVTLKSISLQGFEPGVVQNSYRHQYFVSQSQLEALSRFDLVSMRKYSFKSFADLEIPRENAARLKRLSNLFINELKKANILKSLRHISLKDVRNHIGDSVEFCSKVYRTRYFEGSADGPTLLDMQADFSDPFVNVVILQKDRETFNGAPEKKYLDKEVCISGVLTLQNDIPYLAIRNRNQIKVKSAVNLDEIELFVGDSVTVTGKVFTARYLEDSKTKPTLLNVGAPYPDQPLTLVIEQEEREKFVRPEETYFGKTLRISGIVMDYNGKPQIVLKNPKQVEVIAGPDPVLSFTADKKETGTTVVRQVPAKQAVVDRMEEKAPATAPAEFPGGSEALSVFLRDNLLYPEHLGSNEQKRVIASFDVDTEGNCQNIKIVESAGYDYDNEVKRVLMKMPKWKPAIQNGIFITTHVTQPVTFKGVSDAAPAQTMTSLQNRTTATTKAGKEAMKAATTRTEAKPVEKKERRQTFAEFPGGDSAFTQFIRKHIVIPEEFKSSEKKQITISFDVDAKGVWRNMRLVTSAGKELDKELVRVLKKMPKWKPATQNGVAVATQVVYPVVIFDPALRSN